METGEVISVAVDSAGHHATTVSQAALLEQIQQQQQQAQQQAQQQQQQLVLATSADPSGGNGSGIQVQEPQRGIEMIEFFRKQREREKFCDVILHVQGKQFFAHRMVLAAGSAFFDSIFKSKKTMRENLAISCQDPEIFHNFLNYFYTGSITLKKQNVGELIRLSHHFLVGKLKAYCAEFLERYMDVSNCLHVRQIAEKFQLPSLVKAAIEFVQNNLGELINHEIMMDLPPKQIELFVTEKAYGVPQDASVKFMSRWVCHDITTRERDFKQFLTHIDWNSMDPNLIVDYIDQEPLYGASERCFYYVLHSLAEKGIQVQKYDPMYQALDQRFGQETEPALGFGDNLLQMAFNSAMEGLTDSTSLLLGDRDTNKWSSVTDPGKLRNQRNKLSLTLEQRKRKILANMQRNRATKTWVRLTRERSMRRKIIPDQIEESSGDEECDPIQTESGYRCHLCPFVTKKVSRLERHVSGIHAHDVTYRCSECGYTCKWNRDYFLHMKSHYDGPPYKCQCCEYQCMKIGSLIAHKMGHVDLKPYQCCDCDYKCRSKANLAAHIKSHNNEKPYRCTICGRTFASKNSLDQHAVGHNSEKTYSCVQCPFSTKYLNHFSNHKKTHHTIASSSNTTTTTTATTTAAASGAVTATVPKKSGEVLRCQDSQCKYTTTKKSQLDSHMRSHAGVRPHPCTICGRRFLEKSHLVRHERIHYNERPFKCEECDYASTRRDKLKEHKTRHHGVNASAKSPYKPRPHKSTKQNSFGDQTLVYAKKSTVQQTATQQASSQAQAGQGGTDSQQSQPTQDGQSTGNDETPSELEFIIPHTGGSGSGSATYATHLVGTHDNSLDLQQIANAAGIVQLRQYQDGKEIQVAHTLASIPSSITSAELQRVGLKLEDLQNQALLSGRPIKLEDLGVSVQSSTDSSSNVTQGMAGKQRRSHGTATTVVIEYPNIESERRMGLTSTPSQITVSLGTSRGSNSSSTSEHQRLLSQDSDDVYSGLSALLF